MKWSFATIGLVAAGLVGIVIILLFQNLTVNNEEDYYLLKEITEAAMVDAIDLAYYRDTGKLKIVQEKFVENFTRRFAESANILNTQNYSLEFYNIMEYPPKVSVSVKTDIGEYTIFGNHLETQSYSVANSLDAIIETDLLEENIVKTKECDATKEYISMPYARMEDTEYLHKGAEIKPPNNSGDWEAVDIHFKRYINGVYDVGVYQNNYDDMYETPLSEWAALDPELNEYIAKEISLEFLEIRTDTRKPTIMWGATYKCDNGKQFSTIGGNEHKSKQCILGIIYEVDWHNKDAKCN